jgi:hypothetical protein
MAQRGVFVMSRERRRVLDDEEPAEPGRFGCPMLTRTRFGWPLSESAPVMRCSLGWALHDDVEVARCRATDVVIDCWKAHPERTPVVALPSPAEPDAAESIGAKIAGD